MLVNLWVCMTNELRILMLEDVASDAELIQRELRRAKIPFSIERVETEEGFIRALDEHVPGLILADYSLPSFDALAALRIAQEKCQHVPFILVSGELGDELAVETLKSGATDYVLKEKLSRLAPAVRRALREAQERVDRKHAEEEIVRLNESLEHRVVERTLQLQAANEELEEALHARETLLSIVSHDLRNLVSAIGGSAKLMQGLIVSTGQPEARLMSDGLDRINSAATKMNGLISELIDFAQLQVGQPLELYRRTTNLVVLASRVVAEHQHYTDKHVIRIESGLPALVGLWDAPRLERVLDNLLSNAIKYSPRGGEIVLGVAQDGADSSWAIVTVRDQGIGIPASDLPYIFEWFRRAANVSGRISGTGIGLASVRQVVEQHGGTVEVMSEEGVGSIFTVRLPVKIPETCSTGNAPASPLAPDGKRDGIS